MWAAAETFKGTLAALPGAVAIIGSEDEDKGLVGLTVTSFTPVSLDPALVLFCIDNAARCFASIARCTHFSVNVLAEDQRHTASTFASKSDDKWFGLDYDRGATGAPIIRGCVANLECERGAVLPGGDHAIVVGRVLHCRWGESVRPLLYCNRAYRELRDLERSVEASR